MKPYKILRTTGLDKREISTILFDLLSKGEISLYAHQLGVDVLIKVGEEVGLRIEGEIRRRLSGYIYGEDKESLEMVIGHLLSIRKLSLGVAESCTGGLIMDRLTNIPGSSSYLKGGIVAYSDGVKIGLLGVPEEIIEDKGPVSQEVAIALAKGIVKILKTDIGLGVTGIAGPGGASPEHPVGEVFIGLHTKEKDRVSHLFFKGKRRKIKLLATYAALDLLRRALME